MQTCSHTPRTSGKPRLRTPLRVPDPPWLTPTPHPCRLNNLIRFNTIVRSLKSADPTDPAQGWEVVSETRAEDGSLSTATEHFSHIGKYPQSSRSAATSC